MASPKTRLPGRFSRVVHVLSCSSTQDLAAEDRDSGDAVFWADHQDQGRGRQGRPWHDEAGQDLTVTFRLATPHLPRPARLAVVVPVVVLATLEAVLQRRLTLKWPNDVMADGRKLAGILIDGIGNPPRHAIGVGINVNRVGFPESLGDDATSLALLSGATHDREALLADLAAALDHAVTALEADRTEALAELFADRLGLIGQSVTIVAGNQSLQGTVRALDLDTVRLDDLAPVPLATVRRLER